MLARLSRVLPFLQWFDGYNGGRFRLDLVGGLTVALVLVPQSMAYAQLAGLPPYYGLYAAFLPPMIAALFGSSRQLATGPVAVVSLMTATALEPIATAGSEQYVLYAILLALLVGLFQLLLGVLRLGLVVNFLSHPVVGGFTNAAAIIIATSQLSKVFGVVVEKGEHHYETVWRVVVAAVEHIHWPTFGFALLAFAIMIILRRVNRRLPNVLVAVLITTAVSWAVDYEQDRPANLAQIKDAAIQTRIVEYNETHELLAERSEHRVSLREQYREIADENGERTPAAIRLNNEIELLTVEINQLKEAMAAARQQIRDQRLCMVSEATGDTAFYPTDSMEQGDRAAICQCYLKVSNKPLDPDHLTMRAGGDVVGTIPRGLPAIGIPYWNTSTALGLIPMAMIISLLGFMEAISIAKAMAAKTGQRIDPDQELVGQGLSNIIGACSQSYAVSGSFSRSAVNLQAGAATGLSNVISSAVVVIVLLFLTPLLYHLPQAVLAAIIMMAVVGLINVRIFVHAWRAQRYDGIIGVITFVTTLAFAPHLDQGIMIGVGLSLLLYLLRNTKPAIALLSLHWDHTFRNRDRFELSQCQHIAVIRYAGSLFFANVSYLEEKVIETVGSMPELRHVVLVGNGINELDASGVDALEILLERLEARRLEFSITGLNDSVLDTMKRTGLLARIGEENVYRNVARAVDAVWGPAHEGSKEQRCPLKVVPTALVLPTAAGARKDMEAMDQDRPDKKR
ncbi:STAS domain-containing protein [candidate division GN15 bacterium]|nr:STAS domain-containing protein [candidate division GN15 bacterium]